MTGYLHPAYAQSLSAFGTPRELPLSGGWLLERSIPGSNWSDAMGCYPLFACRDWSRLRLDLQGMGEDLVSLALVTDPFGGCDLTTLEGCFDKVVPFKEHFIVDLGRPWRDQVGEHHRRYLRKALDNVEVELCREPPQHLERWNELYGDLVRKHGIKGMTAFSRDIFARQLAVPGMVAFRALTGEETVAMLLWYHQDDVAYYHLGSSSPRGYQLYASYALFSFALRHFSGLGVRLVDLGAGAGATGNGSDGLTRFKRGWSAQTRSVYFCGRVFHPQRYAELVEAKGRPGTEYFPAYRKGEFA